MSVEVMSGGGASQKLQTKTATPSTSSQSVTPDDGYDGLSEVTVSAMPSGSLNSPTISSSGLVTAQVGTGGYLASGTNKTLQLTTQASKTVTPSTSNQTAVASGRYTTGAVTVKGDSNLVASNIKSGVSIFGVSGTYVGSGSYKIYSGAVEGSYTNFTAVANLNLPTGSDYLDTDKIVWVLIWNETVLEIDEAPIVFWEYQRGYTGGGNRQEIGYMTTGDSHVGYGSQNWTVEAHNGYVTAGWRNTDWNRFDGAATYQYLIVSEI